MREARDRSDNSQDRHKYVPRAFPRLPGMSAALGLALCCNSSSQRIGVFASILNKQSSRRHTGRLPAPVRITFKSVSTLGIHTFG